MGDTRDDEALAPEAPPPSSAFDPPPPPQDSALETAGIIAGGMGVVGAFVVADVCTGGLLSALDSIPWCEDSPRPFDVQAAERSMPGLSQTSPPRFTAEQRAICTRCATAVPFSSMSLNEHGYFCATCAASM